MIKLSTVRWMEDEMELPLVRLQPGKKIPVKTWSPHEKESVADGIWNENQNLGLKTGQVSAVWVIDLDKEIKLPDEIAKLLNRHVRVKTPRGVHYYGCIPDGYPVNTRKLLVDGEEVGDFKGNGGYVVTVPSEVEGHQYIWLGGMPKHASDFRIPFSPVVLNYFGIQQEHYVDVSRKGAPPEGWDDVKEGQRNNIALKMAEYLYYWLHDDEIAWPALCGWNQMKVSPPLELEELQRVFQNAVRYVDKRHPHHRERVSEILPLGGERNIRHTLEEILTQETVEPARTWGKSKLCYDGATTILFGYSAFGKSIFAVSEALQISAHHPVRYIDLEAPRVSERRIKLLIEQCGLLSDEEKAAAMKNYCHYWYMPPFEEINRWDGLVVVDTIRASTGRSFNYSEIAQEYLQEWRMWLEARPGRSVLLVAHANKNSLRPDSGDWHSIAFLEGSEYWAGGADVVGFYHPVGVGNLKEWNLTIVKNRMSGFVGDIEVPTYNLNEAFYLIEEE